MRRFPSSSLCITQAGAIPSTGDALEFSGYRFVVREVEDERRVLSLSAERLVPEKNGHEAERETGAERRGNGGDGDVARSAGGEDGGSHGGGHGADAEGEGELTFRDGSWVEVEKIEKLGAEKQQS